MNKFGLVSLVAISNEKRDFLIGIRLIFKQLRNNLNRLVLNKR